MKLPSALQRFVADDDHGVATLSAADAAALLASAVVQRAVNQQHVAMLTDAIEANDCAGAPMLTLVARPDSHPVLIDGKHILSAHVEASRRNSGLRSLDYVVQVIRNLSPTEASSLYSTKTPFFEGSPAAG